METAMSALEYDARINETMSLTDISNKYWTLDICVKGTKRYAPKGYDEKVSGPWRWKPVLTKTYKTEAAAQRGAKRYLKKYNEDGVPAHMSDSDLEREATLVWWLLNEEQPTDTYYKRLRRYETLRAELTRRGME
tara:strand:- start:408 stop:812 length:405 start_codon:yes stop_codon:yes gene_type:complete